ncbi:MAG TPA: hypothetical protein VFX50_11250, partial [Gemmatimonadales bacterium]|nr:hypothetical protein [Gemmatimonadales bacterium]
MLRVLLVLLLCAATTGSATQDRSPDPAARRLRLTLEPGTAVPPALHADRDVTLRWQARSEDRIVVRGTFDGQDGDSLRIDPEGPLDVFAVSWAS